MRFFLILYILLFCIDLAFTKSWEVGPEKLIKHIKEAISLVEPGDTIYVYPGIYKEGNILIQKSLHLIGIEFPLIDGEFKDEILTLSGDDIHVEGFHIVNSGMSTMKDYAAIKCIDANHVLIQNNFIENSFFSIHLANCSSIHIRYNEIRGNPKSEQTTGNGIHLWKCRDAHIEYNNIKDHRDGIYFEFVTDSEIHCNTSYHNIRYGLHFMFSNNDHYEGNRFVENGAGVAVMYSKKVTMVSNEFIKNWGPASFGILLKDISDSHIFGNCFIENTVGIYMDGSNRTLTEQNEFIKNGWAMKVQASCNDNTIRFNNFKSNSFDIATNGTLVLNSFDGNYWDKYEGYDRTHDGIGDIPYRPVSMYSMIVEQNPYTLILLRSILISFLDKAEKAIPSLTPELLIDHKPKIKAYNL